MGALGALAFALPCTIGEATRARADDDNDDDGNGDGDDDARALLAVLRSFLPDALPLLLPLLRCRLVAPQAFACVQGLARALEPTLVDLADGYASSGTGASGGAVRGMGLERDWADALRIVATVAERPLGASLLKTLTQTLTHPPLSPPSSHTHTLDQSMINPFVSSHYFFPSLSYLIKSSCLSIVLWLIISSSVKKETALTRQRELVPLVGPLQRVLRAVGTYVGRVASSSSSSSVSTPSQHHTAAALPPLLPSTVSPIFIPYPYPTSPPLPSLTSSALPKLPLPFRHSFSLRVAPFLPSSLFSLFP